MSSLTISKVFGISNNYTLEQLKIAYINIIEKLSKSDKTQVEKELLYEQYNKLYKQGKQLFINRMSIDTYNESYKQNQISLNNFSLFDSVDRMNTFGYNNNQDLISNPFTKFDKIFKNVSKQLINNTNPNSNQSNQVYSYASSYKSSTNPDGSITIIESKSETNNDKKNNIIKAYKKLNNGKIIPLTEDEMKQIEKYK